MLEKTWKLRVSAEELSTWKEEAAKRGVLLSEWIRKKCNDDKLPHKPGMPEWPGAAEDVPRDSGVPTSKRREPSAVGITKLSVPAPDICANCEHKKSRHGGWGKCCQEDNCLCERFE